MIELLPGSDLTKALLKVLAVTVWSVKTGVEAGHGAYTKSKERKFQQVASLADEANNNGEDFNFNMGYNAFKNNDFNNAIKHFNASIEKQKESSKDFWQPF